MTKPVWSAAGRILWECVHDAGISRDDVHATNAVKNFKHEVRGKRRSIRHALVDDLRLAHAWAVR